MDFLGKVEYQSLKTETEVSKAAVETNKYMFEQQLKNGLGDKITTYLKNPPSPDKKLEKRLKRAKKWAEFKQRIKLLFIGKNEQE